MFFIYFLIWQGINIDLIGVIVQNIHGLHIVDDVLNGFDCSR